MAGGAVAVEVHVWADGAVYGEFFPVYTETGDLGVEVGELRIKELLHQHPILLLK